MTQYKTLKVKLSNSQLNKLKSGIKNGTQVTLNNPSNVIGDSNDETNFTHKLLLTDTQVSRTQLSKMIQSGEVVTCGIPIFGNILSSVAKKGTDKVRNLAKDFLDKQKDKFNKEYVTSKGSGITLRNNEIKDIVKAIKYLENWGILLKG